MRSPREVTFGGIEALVQAEAVRQTLYDYSYYFDMNLPDDLVSLFTDDCEISYGSDFEVSGKASYRVLLDDVATVYAATSHHVSNIVLNFSDDLTSVTARSVFYAWHSYVRPGKSDGHLYGQYHDELVRDEEYGWRFARRSLRAAGLVDFHVRRQVPIGRRTS